MGYERLYMNLEVPSSQSYAVYECNEQWIQGSVLLILEMNSNIGASSTVAFALDCAATCHITYYSVLLPFQHSRIVPITM